ncbi:uncharacterized protein LOC116572479 isoform X8 [Mustela erminea]|uniref:uncharacterized protein LOC116572479 isoform X8 n=2 Tax=Mustela erminea TaxID=36723 RepID=UPI00138751D8|nr:uncharacterized protein LOC116572479 isoform X8 [Mustela erminea]
MLRQSTAAALQMSVPAPSKELERQQAGGFRAVPFSPTFSPSPPRNLATASFISPYHLHTSPPAPARQGAEKKALPPGSPALECRLVAKIRISPRYPETRGSARGGCFTAGYTWSKG